MSLRRRTVSQGIERTITGQAYSNQGQEDKDATIYPSQQPDYNSGRSTSSPHKKDRVFRRSEKTSCFLRPPIRRARGDIKRKKKKRDSTDQWPRDRPQVRDQVKAPAGKRSRYSCLLDRLETTVQKEKEKPRHCSSLSRNDRQPVHGTGR